MAALDPSETYTHLPLTLDPASKIVSLQSNDPTQQRHVAALNALHQSLKSVETTNQIPPPPMPVNPKRSANIGKMKDTASTAHRKGNYTEAIRLYTFAIDMANTRPAWEHVPVVREELSVLYANRSQSHIAAQNWVEGWKDAESSVECKGFPNPKAWWRAGKCLCEMGRFQEAVKWLTRALEVEDKNTEAGKDLTSLLADAKREANKPIKI